MKNTFTRAERMDTMRADEILIEMREDLSELVSGAAEKEEIIKCAKKLILEAKPLPKNPLMMFWGFDEPQNMPSDSRVAYFYTPSYIAVSTLAYIRLNGPKEAVELEGFEETLKKGLLGATGRSFSGAGHDGLRGIIESFELFAEAKIHEFVDAYPEISPMFTSLFLKTRSYLEQRLNEGKVTGDYGDDYTKEADSIRRKMKDMESAAMIFVYGTLLQGNRNHEYFLSGSSFIDEAVLPGYALYNLGSYPGMKREKGDSVKGEVYVVNKETLERINQLEGEGSLYALREVTAVMEDGEIPYIKSYVYLHEVEEKNHVSIEEQPWGRKKDMSEDNLVWYAAYGSNMLYERFMHYINGGKFRGNGRDHKPCKDHSAPRARMTYEFKHDMYYANTSGSWDGMGVSFLNVSRPGKAYGIAYLITEEQFDHLAREENGGVEPRPGSSWYNHKAELGMHEGIPVKTVTNSRILQKNEPGQKYMEVLMEGLRENCPDLSEKEIRDYVESRNR